MLQTFKKCLDTGLDVFVVGDININTSPESSHNFDFNITALNDIYMDFKISTGLIQINKEFTRYASNSSPTILDHILTNRPSLIKKIVTKVNSISDHCHILTEITSKPSVELPKFRRVRNWTECTVENLRVEVMASEPLQTLYALTDPQTIACTLSNELSRIIDKLAPPKGYRLIKIINLT